MLRFLCCSELKHFRGVHTSAAASRVWSRSRLVPRRRVNDLKDSNLQFAARYASSEMPVVRPPIGRAILYFGTVALVSFGGCAAWSVFRTEKIAKQSASQNWTSMGSFFIDQYDTRQLNDTERHAQLASLHKRLVQFKNLLAFLPTVVQEPSMRAALSLTEWYIELPSFKQAAIPVIVVNTGVFACWMMAPRLGLSLLMQRYFTARPASGRVYTMLTSVFSHKAPAHFLFNNLALWSVGASSLTILASRKAWKSDVPIIPDVIPGPHFLAFFVTAGTFASLASHLVTALRWRAASSILKQATRSVPRASLKARAELNATIRLANTVLSKLAQRASLGSSGAIYAAFVLSALTYPQATLSVMFLPFTAIPIQWGMSG